jgi:hypothetical protein
MLGHVSQADRKLIPAILKEALDAEEEKPPASENVECMATNEESGVGQSSPILSEAIAREETPTSLTILCTSPSTLPQPIEDQPVDLPGSEERYQATLCEVGPIIDSLSHDLGNVSQASPRPHLRLTRGRLDAGRLAIAPFAQSIFKRDHQCELREEKERPLVLIAADASGSMTRTHMEIIKMLCVAWLRATVPLGVQNLIGLYHSGSVCEGVSQPLVRWIHHPEKTTSAGGVDPDLAAISFPHQGSGVQSDVLSLRYITTEARRLAKGTHICLSVISDCNWNSSFGNSLDGAEEMRLFFQQVRKELNGALHACVVGLGVSGSTGMEIVVDDIVTIPKEAMRNPLTVAAQIASRIAAFVLQASKVRQRYTGVH